MSFFPYWIRIKNAIGKFDEVIVLKSIGNIFTLSKLPNPKGKTP